MGSSGYGSSAETSYCTPGKAGNRAAYPPTGFSHQLVEGGRGWVFMLQHLHIRCIREKPGDRKALGPWGEAGGWQTVCPGLMVPRRHDREAMANLPPGSTMKSLSLLQLLFLRGWIHLQLSCLESIVLYF